MELSDPCESYSSSTSRDEKAEAMELLDEYWFYKNLLHRRTWMLRSSSDPCPSKNKIQDMVLENSSISNDLPNEDGFVRRNLLRIPSLPLYTEKESLLMEKEINCVSSKLVQQSSLNCNLLRTPSLPSTIGREKKEFAQEKDIDHVTSKLIPRASISCNLLRSPSLPPCIRREKVAREEEISSKLAWLALLNSSNVSPSRRTSKKATPSPNIPIHRPRSESKVGSMTKDSKNKLYLTKDLSYGCESDKKSCKSLTDLEFEEVQGFKDLGFIFDEKDLNSNVVNIIPGLQGKRADDEDQERVRQPYLSDAWLVQRSNPPLPRWVDSRSMGDMKAQLRFWARAVASNMRQGS